MDGLLKNVKKQKVHMRDEELANVYHFRKEMLATPTSMNMMNAICLKNADVDKMDELFHKMKKRRNIQIMNTNTPYTNTTFQNSIGPMSNAPHDGKGVITANTSK